MRIRLAAGGLATGLVLTLAASLGLGTTAGAAADDREAAVSTPAAKLALADAQAVLAGRSADRNATLVLRELLIRRAELNARDRATAARVLARPSASQRECTPRICVHWNPGQVDGDGDGNGISDYIDEVVATVDSVHQTYVAAGYQAPRPDGKKGGDKRTDIYIENIGPEGLYGYCTSDQRRETDRYAINAFCVLDNDYRPSEFPTNTPIENMQVTAAHEYFHAVQFSYDYREDGWIMEATATWAEDELFDDVDDNVNYLGSSPLSNPRRALDRFGGGFQYGGWIFFRFLTEEYADEQGGMPRLVLDMWELMDGSTDGPDLWSTQAVNRVLTDRGSSLREEFAAFSAANLNPGSSYEEGSANGYPAAPTWDEVPLAPDDEAAGGVELDHLSSATARLYPDGTEGLYTLRVDFDMAPTTRGSTALVSVAYLDGHREEIEVPLDSEGDARVSDIPFDSDAVESVDVILVNASTRTRKCWTDNPYSCSGKPRDDNQVATIDILVTAG